MTARSKSPVIFVSRLTTDLQEVAHWKRVLAVVGRRWACGRSDKWPASYYLSSLSRATRSNIETALKGFVGRGPFVGLKSYSPPGIPVGKGERVRWAVDYDSVVFSFIFLFTVFFYYVLNQHMIRSATLSSYMTFEK